MKKVFKKRDRAEIQAVLKSEIALAKESRARQAARAEQKSARKKSIKRGKRQRKPGLPGSAKVKQPFAKIGAPHPDYVKSEDFFTSREWRQLRYLALKNANGRCQCCGASSKDGALIHVDHIIPRYKRPDLSLSLDNLQVLCEDCNIGKGAWDSTDWR